MLKHSKWGEELLYLGTHDLIREAEGDVHIIIAWISHCSLHQNILELRLAGKYAWLNDICPTEV